MSRCPFTNNRGIALIVVILMITVVVALTLELNKSTRFSIYEAANLADQIRLSYVAKSGFNLGVAMLLNDKNTFDALNEDWAIPEIVQAKSAGLFDDESLQINITDESGKIPVNKLVNGNVYNVDMKELLIRLLNQPEFGLTQQKVSEIVDSIKDWIDSDDMITGDGAESAYYKTRDTPYASKNKPLDCIDELLMIKSITREIYYGTRDAPGIRMFLTVYDGDGRININTAPKAVLRAFFGISTDTADQLDAYRKLEGRDLSDPAWFRNISAMADIPVNMGLITTKSNYFEISAAGRQDDMVGQVSGVIRRQADHSKGIELLSWKVE